MFCLFADDTNPAPQSDLAPGAIAGIVICVIIVVLVIGILGYAYFNPRSKLGNSIPKVICKPRTWMDTLQNEIVS